MLFDILLLRYGELFLKGGNRGIFERKLVENIKKITSIKEVERIRNRLVTGYFSDHQELKRVFGLVSYSPAAKSGKDVEEIKEQSLKILLKLSKLKKTKLNEPQLKEGAFKIETKRSDKSFLVKSPDLNILVGKFIEEKTHLKFSREAPEITLNIEINEEGAYFFTETFPCFGGLPTGVGGKMFLLVENEASLLAGSLLMKRGCNVVPVTFPQKKSLKEEISLLERFSPIKLNLLKVNDFLELEDLAEKENVNVLASGQSYAHYSDYNTKLVVLRPLIGYSENNIKMQVEVFKD